MRRAFPWRETSDPYRIIVAELLLQQTFARKVVPIYEEFLRRYPSATELARAHASKIRSLILPLGLQYRAKTLKALGRILVEENAGKVPDDLRSLLKLPGVGAYTANAVLCFAYGKRRPVVDTNVVRVLQRFFGSKKPLRPGETDRMIWEFAERVLPQRDARRYNIAILDFAALVCTHYKPQCSTCPLRKHCKAAPSFLAHERDSLRIVGH